MDIRSCQLDITTREAEEAIVYMNPKFAELIKAANTQDWSRQNGTETEIGPSESIGQSLSMRVGVESGQAVDDARRG